MKHIFLSLFLLALVASTQAQSETYKIDTQKSSVAWFAEKVTGTHDGRVNLKSGNLIWTGDKLSGGSFEIDMTSITCRDIESAEYNAKLVGHLKSDDFFSVEKNPVAKMVISRVIHQGKSLYKIEAKMTIKGITNDIKFNADVKNENGLVTGVAEITIDRTEFDIRYGSGSFFDDLGDKTIYDEFKLKVSIVSDKK